MYGHASSLGRPLGAAAPAPAAAAAPAEAPPADLTKYTTAAAPILSSLIGGKDSTENVETLRAQIKNHQALRDKFPEPLKTLYGNKVRVLKARLKAALSTQKRDKEDRASKWEWATLGKVGLVTGISIGAALILLIAVSTRRMGAR